MLYYLCIEVPFLKQGISLFVQQRMGNICWLPLPFCWMYLSNVFVRIAKCICPNCKMYLSKFPNVFVKIARCICIIEQWIFLFARQRMRGIFRPLCSECRLPLPNAPFSPSMKQYSQVPWIFQIVQSVYFSDIYNKAMESHSNNNTWKAPFSPIYETIQPSSMNFSDCEICISLTFPKRQL